MFNGRLKRRPAIMTSMPRMAIVPTTTNNDTLATRRKAAKGRLEVSKKAMPPISWGGEVSDAEKYTGA